MMMRMSRDVRSAVAGPKIKYMRPRPYLSGNAPICIRPGFGFRFSPDYPSGHATWGWTVGLLLAEVAPDRANPILARARAYGESRVICGVHNASSVDAGKRNAGDPVRGPLELGRLQGRPGGGAGGVGRSARQGLSVGSGPLHDRGDLVGAPLF